MRAALADEASPEASPAAPGRSTAQDKAPKKEEVELGGEELGGDELDDNGHLDGDFDLDGELSDDDLLAMMEVR